MLTFLYTTSPFPLAPWENEERNIEYKRYLLNRIHQNWKHWIVSANNCLASMLQKEDLISAFGFCNLQIKCCHIENAIIFVALYVCMYIIRICELSKLIPTFNLRA